MTQATWKDGTPKSQNNAFDWQNTSEFMRQFMTDAQRSDRNGSAGRAAAKVYPQVMVYSVAFVGKEKV